MLKINLRFLFLILLFLTFGCKQTEKKIDESTLKEFTNYLKESKEEKDSRMQWWKDARFGMFIHWGLYSVPAGEWKGNKTEGLGEWLMNDLQIPIEEYETISTQFNPSAFDAKLWVELAKNAGMKYIVITAKHADGFALWDSEVSKWDITSTPFNRDPLKELQVACEAADIKLCFYYCIMDWHNMDAQGQFYPDYNVFPQDDSIRASATLPKYIEEKLKPQVKELLTNYGDVGIMWFDGEWINGYTSNMGKEIYQFVRELQPDIIINNRVDKGRNGSMTGMNVIEGEFAGDYGTPEQEIPETGLPGVDWETCQTMNNSWGYKHFDNNWKSDTTMIRELVDIASKGGNYLLNIGPSGTGEIPKPSIEVLQAMGRWMDTNGESIYSTSASPIEAPEWGRITTKGEKTLYLHVFDWPEDGVLNLNIEMNLPLQAKILGTNARVSVNTVQSGIMLQLPNEVNHSICTVVKLTKE